MELDDQNRENGVSDSEPPALEIDFEPNRRENDESEESGFVSGHIGSSGNEVFVQEIIGRG